jgi:membrane protein
MIGKGSWQILKRAFLLLKRNDPLRMAGATAFFTSFSLPFILIILIQLFGLVLDRQQLSRHLFHGLSDVVGNPGTQQIREISRGFRRLATNGYIAAGGFIFLLFVVTTLFKVVKDSINQLWQIQPADGKLSDNLWPRLRSIGLILLAGLLFLADLATESLLAILRHAVIGWGSMAVSTISFVLQQLVSFGIVTGWIVSLFLFLPDGRFSVKVTVKGALLTGALFTVGKLVLAWLLISSNIRQIYGTSGAFVVVLLFVFYIALILYYGVAFTAVVADYGKEAVRPAAHARLSRSDVIGGRS